MTMKDGTIELDKKLNVKNLSEVIAGLSYHIAMEYINYLNEEWNGQDEWEYIIEAEDDDYTLKIQIREWHLKKGVFK